MNTTDKDKFKTLMLAAGELYDKTITSALLGLYWKALEPLTLSQVDAAITAHTCSPDRGQWFPKPADIHFQVTGSSKQQEQADADLAELGWQELMAHFRKWGHRSPFFGQDPQELVFKPSDARSLVALSMVGGYGSLKGITEGDLKWKRKEFCEAFGTAGRVNPERLPASLPGRDELVALTVQKATTLALASKEGQ